VTQNLKVCVTLIQTTVTFDVRFKHAAFIVSGTAQSQRAAAAALSLPACCTTYSTSACPTTTALMLPQ
jgi:hypothetical protein